MMDEKDIKNLKANIDMENRIEDLKCDLREEKHRQFVKNLLWVLVVIIFALSSFYAGWFVNTKLNAKPIEKSSEGTWELFYGICEEKPVVIKINTTTGQTSYLHKAYGSSGFDWGLI